MAANGHVLRDVKPYTLLAYSVRTLQI